MLDNVKYSDYILESFIRGHKLLGDQEMMTINIDDNLHDAARIAARVLGLSIKDFVTDAIKAKIESEKPHVLAAIEEKMTVPENGAVAEAK